MWSVLCVMFNVGCVMTKLAIYDDIPYYIYTF